MWVDLHYLNVPILMELFACSYITSLIFLNWGWRERMDHSWIWFYNNRSLCNRPFCCIDCFSSRIILCLPEYGKLLISFHRKDLKIHYVPRFRKKRERKRMNFLSVHSKQGLLLCQLHSDHSEYRRTGHCIYRHDSRIVSEFHLFCSKILDVLEISMTSW